MSDSNHSMIDAAPASRTKKRRLWLMIAGAVALALIGFFASRAGLDKALVKQQLDDFIAQVKEKGQAQGRDITITYGELAVVGRFAAKHVVVHDPVLSIQPSNRTAPKPGEKPVVNGLRITTDRLEIYPDAMDVSRLRIEAPTPIRFADIDAPDHLLLSVKSNVAPIVIVGHKTLGDTLYHHVSYQSPSEMEFTYLRERHAKGVEDQTPDLSPVYETLSISMAPGGAIDSSMAADASGLGRINVAMQAVKLIPKAAPQGAITIAEITGEWSNQLNDKKLNVVHALASIGPITADIPTVPYLPIALHLDATYEGAMPKNAQAIASIQSPDSLITLKQFSLTSKDASLSATANFTASASDVLPVGTANMTLTNIPFVMGELRKYKVLNARNEAVVQQLLQLLTGKPVAEIRDAVIPIERARGGAFRIGQTTFEELFTVLLKGAWQLRPAASEPPMGAPASIAPEAPQSLNQGHVPRLPPAGKPRLAPIEILDQSVRG